jgi:hypothetical protein
LISNDIRSLVHPAGYQIDFLNSCKAEGGAAGAAGALQAIVDKAMSDDKVKAAIFDDFHCIHCGSVSPAEWIASRKGKKELCPESQWRGG